MFSCHVSQFRYNRLMKCFVKSFLDLWIFRRLQIFIYIYLLIKCKKFVFYQSVIEQWRVKKIIYFCAFVVKSYSRFNKNYFLSNAKNTRNANHALDCAWEPVYCCGIKRSSVHTGELMTSRMRVWMQNGKYSPELSLPCIEI